MIWLLVLLALVVIAMLVLLFWDNIFPSHCPHCGSEQTTIEGSVDPSGRQISIVSCATCGKKLKEIPYWPIEWPD